MRQPLAADLALFDPVAHLGERWPATLWVLVAVECERPPGQPPFYDFLVPFAPEPGYILAGIGSDLTAATPLPALNAAAFVQQVCAQAAAAQPALLTARSAAVSLFDGYLYHPATHLVRTMQQDLADAWRLFPHASSAPAVLAGE